MHLDVRARPPRRAAGSPISTAATRAAVLVVLGLVLALLPAPAGKAADDVTFDRLAGETRIETAVEISRSRFQPGVDVAFLARDSAFPDALAAGPVAALAGAPILLTRTMSLPEATAAELRRLQPGGITVLGGTSAISDEVVRRLEQLTEGDVRRHAGSDRFATAAAIATGGFGPGVPVAYVSTGVNFPDALAGGVAAAGEDGPILLVTSRGVPPGTADALRQLRPERVVVLGGEGAITASVEQALGQLTGAPVERLCGTDRVATAAAISRRSFPGGADEVFVATGLDFPDSLAAAPGAHLGEAPLLLVTQRVTDVLADEFRRLSPQRVTVLGGDRAVSGDTVEVLRSLLDGGAGHAVIDVWYGSRQTVGNNGRPQARVNVVGRAAPEVAGLSYRLNGGSDVALRLGPDTRRLSHRGDFNIEIPFSRLRAGGNEVEITATSNTGSVLGRRTVTLQHEATPPLSLPGSYTVTWSGTSRIDHVAHVTDGSWQLCGATVRATEFGYDRMIALGDTSWTDYEVTVPITVHEREGISGPPSNNDAVGLALRWSDHVEWDGVTEPRWGFYPLGALPVYNFGSSRLEIQGNNNRGRVARQIVHTPFTWEFGVPFVMKARVQTHPSGGSHYHLKAWRQGQPEPSGWHVTLEQPEIDDHPNGSILLLAHHVKASFGQVTVRRL